MDYLLAPFVNAALGISLEYDTSCQYNLIQSIERAPIDGEAIERMWSKMRPVTRRKETAGKVVAKL